MEDNIVRKNLNYSKVLGRLAKNAIEAVKDKNLEQKNKGKEPETSLFTARTIQECYDEMKRKREEGFEIAE